MSAHTHIPGLFPGPGALLGCLEYRAVFDSVLVDADKVQGLCVTRGGAGHQALQAFAHEPLVCLGCHFTGHMLLGPFVHPGLEALVQPLAHPFVGLQKQGEALGKGSFGPRTAALHRAWLLADTGIKHTGNS